MYSLIGLDPEAYLPKLLTRIAKQRRARVHRLQSLGHALQAVGDGDQDVFAAGQFQVIEDLQPELGPFGLLDSQPQDVPAAVGPHAQRQEYRLDSGGIRRQFDLVLERVNSLPDNFGILHQKVVDDRKIQAIAS